MRNSANIFQVSQRSNHLFNWGDLLALIFVVVLLFAGAHLAFIAPSVTSTVLFPVILLLVLILPGGLNLAAMVLMLMGTQWWSMERQHSS